MCNETRFGKKELFSKRNVEMCKRSRYNLVAPGAVLLVLYLGRVGKWDQIKKNIYEQIGAKGLENISWRST